MDHKKLVRRLLPLSLALAAVAAQAQLPPGDGPASTVINVVEPSPVKFDDALLAQLRLPPGFRISVFARDLANVRWLQPMPNGDVYASRREQGDIVLLRDTNRDGVADEKRVVAQNLKWAHGLALRGASQLYIATDKKVLAADILPDGNLSIPRILIDDLPDAGQHPNRTLAFGPDGLLYITVGSTCNDCRDTNPENATVVRAHPDGSGRHVYAQGLRNTIGFGWHPTGQLYGFDHGSDYHGEDTPPEELNAIQANKHYGWPFCFADRRVDPQVFNDPPNSSKGAFCPTTQAPALTYTAHAAPIGMAFYTGNQFPADYRNDAFVAFRGSWNRAQPSGYRVARVRFDAAGKPTAIEDFITGWLLPAPPPHLQQPGSAPPGPEQDKARRPAQFGRLAGLAVHADGSLLIAEDQNGVVYRVTHGR